MTLPTLPILELKTIPNPAILLHPQIPKELWGVNPRKIFGTQFWDKARKECYAFYDHRCFACGRDMNKKSGNSHPWGIRHQAGMHRSSKKWLEAHEVFEYDFATYNATFRGTVALCHLCHMYIHRGYVGVKAAMASTKREKTKWTKRQSDIVGHGSAILNSVDKRHQLHSRFVSIAKTLTPDFDSRYDAGEITRKMLLTELPYGAHVHHSGGIMIVNSSPKLKRKWHINILGKDYGPFS